jgi:hypothetical protein
VRQRNRVVVRVLIVMVMAMVMSGVMVVVASGVDE